MTIGELILHPRTEALVQKYTAHLPSGLVIDGPQGTGVATVAAALGEAVGSPAFRIEAKKKVKTDWVVDLRDGSVIIDDIRRLYEQTRARIPGEHVYVIDTGEKSMTIAAQNAFLKLLEEPRSGVHFIIATHRPDLLLPTIFSRCQRLTLLPITDEQTDKLLLSLSIKDTTKKARLAFVGQGRPALIRQLVDNDDLYDARVQIMTDAKSLISGDSYDKMTIIQRYRLDRPASLTLLDDMNRQLQAVIRKQPDPRIATDIDKHLKTHERIAAGGNIRLQLAADVL